MFFKGQDYLVELGFTLKTTGTYSCDCGCLASLGAEKPSHGYILTHWKSPLETAEIYCDFLPPFILGIQHGDPAFQMGPV